MKALEIGIGGKLNAIVVENDNIAAALLGARSFGGCYVNLIPNSKIQGKEVPSQVVEMAKRWAQEEPGGIVMRPLEVIDYNRTIHPTLVYAAGNFVFFFIFHLKSSL